MFVSRRDSDGYNLRRSVECLNLAGSFSSTQLLRILEHLLFLLFMLSKSRRLECLRHSARLLP